MQVNPYLLWMIIATFGALSLGTIIRLIALRGAPSEKVSQRIGSLKVWWLLAVLWSTAAVIGLWGVAMLLAIGSLLAMREYLRLVGPAETLGIAAIGCLMILGLTHYALIAYGQSGIARWFFPIGSLLLLGAVRAATCETKNYIRITGGMYWGAMLMIYGVSHGLFLFEFASPAPTVGVAGWFLFLILLTEMNDISQALVGRKVGKHKIAPVVSPHKTLEGLLGGLACTASLAICLAPYLTTLTRDRSQISAFVISIAAGLVISAFGFLGDINISAIKRDAGVKDGSSMLPGMGGVIDRVDSLTFTAPAFYYFVVCLHAA